MPEAGQDQEALRNRVEQALGPEAQAAAGRSEGLALALSDRLAALADLAEQERQAQQGVPQGPADLPAPLAELAPGLARAAGADPVVFGPADLAAGLAEAGRRWAEAMAPLAEALARPVVHPLVARPAEAYPGEAADQAELAALRRRQEELGQALDQEAALLRQAVADLAARLSGELAGHQAEPDLVALSRLAGADPAAARRPVGEDLPAAERQAALARAVARRLAVLYPSAGPDRLELMTRQVAHRLSRPAAVPWRPAGE